MTAVDSTGNKPAPRARRPVTALLAGSGRRRAATWDERFRSGQGDKREADLAGQGTGWTIVSYLLSGMAAYGGIGWLIGHYTHVGILFPIGMLIGLGISLGWIIYRYGRQ